MNKTLQKIQQSRPDLSDYLYHFTKGSKASETLWKIIGDEKILDPLNRGVICFTEAPIYQMLDMFKIFEGYKEPMYAPFGIAIPKWKLYSLGARPVIYGPQSELSLFPDDLKWRYEPIEKKHDFSWLREWRINTSEVSFQLDDIFIVTKIIHDGLGITHSPDVIIDGDWADGQWWDQSFVAWDREIKSISLDTIVESAISDSTKLLFEIEKQSKEIMDGKSNH
ncbi:MAG: hypothetical protein KDC83_14870 [Flavobacteriales bacterium]|nr:hypothetical protein [Flavobacteriales bacterium]MCB0535988.1 hypothetical protein [Bacteroidota bacterium]